MVLNFLFPFFSFQLHDLASAESAERLANFNRAQQECDQNAEQIKEVLKALEDMALNYQSQGELLETKKEELENLQASKEKMQVRHICFDTAHAWLALGTGGGGADTHPKLCNLVNLCCVV